VSDAHGDAWEDPHDRPAKAPARLPIMPLGQLVATYPRLRPPLIDGLLRRGETMNVIASPKVGKSWLTYGLGIAVATGAPWLGTFPTAQGAVLLIDNELHPETIANRIPLVAAAMGVEMAEVNDRLSILSLRGRLQNLIQLGAGLGQIDRSRFALIVIDAFYRTLPLGTDENDNAGLTALYNRLDHYADSLGVSFALVHHTSKGSQSEKAVTDVGSGAGAQSRAVDTHLILRPHEENDVVVLDAAVRSWPPVSPLCLRWSFPVWGVDNSLDPTLLRTAKPRRRKDEGQEPKKPAEPPWTAKRFADAFGRPEPRARPVVLEEARLCGLSDAKAEKLLKAAIGCTYLHAWKERGANSETMICTVAPAKNALKQGKKRKKRG
jgi:hypothetical protein